MTELGLWPCPSCGLRAFVEHLNTTNPWERHCTKCDIRFSDAGEIRPVDRHKVCRVSSEVEASDE